MVRFWASESASQLGHLLKFSAQNPSVFRGGLATFQTHFGSRMSDVFRGQIVRSESVSQLGDLHQSSQRRIPLFSEAKSESMLKHSDFWSAEIRHSLSVEPARQLREARAKIRLFGVLNLYDNLCIVSRLLKTQTGKLYTNRHTNSLAKVASAESLCFQRQISPLSGLFSRAD